MEIVHLFSFFALCLKSLNYYMLRNTIFYLLVLNFFTAKVFLHVSDLSAAVVLVPGLSAGMSHRHLLS